MYTYQHNYLKAYRANIKSFHKLNVIKNMNLFQMMQHFMEYLCLASLIVYGLGVRFSAVTVISDRDVHMRSPVTVIGDLV